MELSILLAEQIFSLLIFIKMMSGESAQNYD